MRFFKKGKPSNMLGNNGITYGFFLPLRSLDRQFLKKNGQKTKIEEKTKDITYCLDTFFPRSIEGRGRKRHQSVPFCTNIFLKKNLKFFEIFFGQARDVKRHER